MARPNKHATLPLEEQQRLFSAGYEKTTFNGTVVYTREAPPVRQAQPPKK